VGRLKVEIEDNSKNESKVKTPVSQLSQSEATLLQQEIHQIIKMGPYRRNSEDFEDAKDDESQRLA
jgi:hypothetical protein